MVLDLGDWVSGNLAAQAEKSTPATNSKPTLPLKKNVLAQDFNEI
jgi:hypothetical protein